MRFKVLQVVCAILSITYATRAKVEVSGTKPKAPATTRSLLDNVRNSVESGWSTLYGKFTDLMGMKKNVIAGYPLQLVSTVVDKLCSSTLFMHSVPPRFTPDINKMNFQYITTCKNYSVPLMQAEQLWRHMNFNKVRKVVILATGWTNTVGNSATLALLSKAYLCRKDVNFIIVDVAFYVDTLYKWSAINTEEIGESIAKGLRHLKRVVPLKNIHLVGHSLGAHIMGTAGRTFTKLTGLRIPRITGLDPAKPCFRKNETLSSLRSGDAEFVDIVHTNIGVLGKNEPTGDIDFYPGGANALPPGCLTAGCAHTRSVEYFAESVYPGNAQNFIGWKCTNWQALVKMKCNREASTPMGQAVNQQQKGIYYVKVNPKSPYGKSAKPSSARWENAKCNKCEKSQRKRRSVRRVKAKTK